jgi:hypothetical protein
MAGSLRRDIVGLLVAHYARPHTEILTVPGQGVVESLLDRLAEIYQTNTGMRADIPALVSADKRTRNAN